MPTVTEKINSALANIGTLILILPLTILILSLLYPENYTYCILGSFFGVASTLFVFIYGIGKGTITEMCNLKIFMIKRILTLEEKRIILKEEIINIIESKYKSTLVIYENLKKILIENNIEIYDEKLLLLKDKISIKIYASEIIQNATNIILKNSVGDLTESNIKLTQVLKYTTYLLGGLVCVVAIFAIIRYLTDNYELKEGFTLVKEGAERSSQMAAGLLTTQKILHESTPIVKELAMASAIAAGNEIVEATKQGFANTEKRLEIVESQVESVVTLLETLYDKFMKE
jgi:hypothetical protein